MARFHLITAISAFTIGPYTLGAGVMPLFRVTQVLDGGDEISEIDVADVDLDGDDDVLATAIVGGEVRVFLNDGGGTLALSQAFGIGDGEFVPYAIFADIDSDGWPDVVAAGGASVAVLWNDGGILSPPVLLPSAGAVSVATGDFNGDGQHDIVAAVFSDDFLSNLAVYLRDGRAFAAPQVIPLAGGDQTITIALRSPMISADLNGDGIDDVVTMTNSNITGPAVVEVWHGSLLGGLTLHDSAVWDGGGVDVALKDLNGDGHVDLIGAMQAIPIITSTLLSQGAPVDLAVEPLIVPAFGDLPISPSTVHVADFAGDAPSSVLTTTTLGTGAPGLWEPIGSTYIPSLFPQSGPMSAHPIDADQDGLLDIVIAESNFITPFPVDTEDDPLVLLSNTGLGFTESEAIEASVANNGLTSGLINSDTRPDLIIAGDDGIRTLLSETNGGFTQGPTALEGTSLAAAVAIDLDLDGDSDIAALDQASALHVLHNLGGELQLTHTYALPPGAFSGASRDLDNDGDQDLVLGTVPPTVAMNDGDLLTLTSIGPSNAPLFQTVLADVNGDGLADIVGGSILDVRVFLGSGGGAFEAPVILGEGRFSAAALDFDADGDLDIASTDSGDVLVVHMNDGNGVFSSVSLFDLGVLSSTNVHHLFATDIDGDSLDDLVMSSVDPSSAVVALNEPGAGFIAFTLLAAPSTNARALTVADFNADALPDVAIGSPQTQSVGVFIQHHPDAAAPCPADLNGSGSVESTDLNTLLSDFGCVTPDCPADLDGDGDTDSADLNLLLAAFGEDCP